jgi:eukaryotic-like serine/threonine-protein kinase
VANADRIIELLHEAKAHPAGTERARFLNEACRDDAALKEQVVSLLEADADDGGAFLRNTLFVRPTAPVTEKPGDRIGRYKLLEQIGEGGCGAVYMAEQEEPVRRRVALKVIKLGMDTKQVIARFEAERQALAMMDHPNIAKVLDGGATETGRPYFVMELVRGIKITDYCDQNHLPTNVRLKLFIQVCQAIQHAHQKGIIHRDIKPSNILVTQHDDVAVPKVIDFGIAKATVGQLTDKTVFTAFAQFIGTPAYMSPEQAQMSGLDIDTRADIYSLGVLLYELLTGNTPFDAKELLAAGMDEMRRKIREDEPAKPSTCLSTMTADQRGTVAGKRGCDPKRISQLVAGELDWAVMKCLAKDRNERYASASDLAAEFDRWLKGEPLCVRGPTLEYLLRIWVRRNFGSSGWAVGLGIIWGIIGGVVCWLVMLNPLELSVALRRAIYLIGVGFGSSGGIITVWLVRPKNAAADLLSATVTGTLAAVICYTLSWGWVAVKIAGVPYGIWLGMAGALLVVASLCIIETLAAGMLLRRHGRISAAIGPYIEIALPLMLAVVFSSSVLFRLATVGLGERAWHLYMIPVLLPAIAGVLRRWPWPVRALLHGAWVTSLCIFGLH